MCFTFFWRFNTLFTISFLPPAILLLAKKDAVSIVNALLNKTNTYFHNIKNKHEVLFIHIPFLS
jgi:hypothetical protein